jgi:hypothetical protein
VVKVKNVGQENQGSQESQGSQGSQENQGSKKDFPPCSPRQMFI